MGLHICSNHQKERENMLCPLITLDEWNQTALEEMGQSLVAVESYRAVVCREVNMAQAVALNPAGFFSFSSNSFFFDDADALSFPCSLRNLCSISIRRDCAAVERSMETRNPIFECCLLQRNRCKTIVYNSLSLWEARLATSSRCSSLT